MWLAAGLREVPAGRRLRNILAVRFVEAAVAARPSPSVRVLDAGCEEGLLSIRLGRRHPSWTIVATDLARAPLERGAARARAESPNVHFVQSDLTRSLGVGGYDVIVSVESLSEIPDDEAALASFVAALAPGGVVYLQVPRHDWTPALPGGPRTWRRQARHGYRAGDLERRLEQSGLRVLTTTDTFHRLTALCEDLRSRSSGRRRLALLPLSLLAVQLELWGVRLGKPRALIVAAVKPRPATAV